MQIQLPDPLTAVVAEIAAARGESFDLVASNLIFSGLLWHGPSNPMGVNIDLDSLANQLDALETEGGAV